MKAIHTDLSFVQRSCPPGVYHSYWELLCNELFAQSTLGLEAEGTFPDVKIWSTGIEMTKNTAPYTFTVTTDEEVPPKTSDIILYGKKFYIIQSVSAGAEEGEYVCSGCISIDASILAVYTALLSLDQTITAHDGEYQENEAGRVSAEAERVTAEAARAAAEALRVQAENNRVIAEGLRVIAEASREPRLQALEAVVPTEASSTNKLADKAFVNSSIATATAKYISNNGVPFTSLAQLQAYAGPVDENDYAFVSGTDAAGNSTYTRYKYSNGSWAEEYVLNNSSFTAAQWAAISSGITSGLVAKLIGLPTKTALDTLLDALVPKSAIVQDVDDPDGNKVPSQEAVYNAIREVKSSIPAPDWGQNETDNKNFIKGRTHWFDAEGQIYGEVGDLNLTIPSGEYVPLSSIFADSGNDAFWSLYERVQQMLPSSAGEILQIDSALDINGNDVKSDLALEYWGSESGNIIYNNNADAITLDYLHVSLMEKYATGTAEGVHVKLPEDFIPNTIARTSAIVFEKGRGLNSAQQKNTGATAKGDVSVAEGKDTNANGDYSHAEGEFTRTTNECEHAEGRSNKSTKTSNSFGSGGNTLHSIGMGSNAFLQNAFEIMQNGDAYFYGIGGYNGTNPFSAGVKTIQKVVSDLETTVSGIETLLAAI